jgi:hypothetical protein
MNTIEKFRHLTTLPDSKVVVLDNTEAAKLLSAIDAMTAYLPYLPTSEPFGAARHADQVVKAYELRQAILKLEAK